ncbi:MAG: hypothetical protein MUC33_06140 [Desulfobacterales bacterium]|nr:hypothetical protein [Desulfobacterales bacterium]
MSCGRTFRGQIRQVKVQFEFGALIVSLPGRFGRGGQHRLIQPIQIVQADLQLLQVGEGVFGFSLRGRRRVQAEIEGRLSRAGGCGRQRRFPLRRPRLRVRFEAQAQVQIQLQFVAERFRGQCGGSRCIPGKQLVHVEQLRFLREQLRFLRDGRRVCLAGGLFPEERIELGI